MPASKHLSIILAASLLSGCSVMDGVWSTLSGGSGTPATGRVVAIPTPKADASAQPVAAVATTAAQPTAAVATTTASVSTAPAIIPAGGSVKAVSSTSSIVALSGPNAGASSAAPGASGTSAGTPQAQGLRAEVQRLDDDLGRQNGEIQRLHQALAQDSAGYYGTVATIHSRLQLGTTADNPELVAQWNLAQVALDRMSADVSRLAVLSGEAASDSALATRILDSVKTGDSATDPKQLQAIEGDTRTAQAQVQQLVDTVAQDIARQTAYLENERSNLVGLMAAIKNGELYGKRLPDGRYVASLGARSELVRDAALSGGSARKPLVVIRFREPNVAYEDALYGAVKSALERRPSANFDLVAVAPAATAPAQVDARGCAAKRYAATVLHSLTEMGLPADRVSLSSTTSAQVKNEEVDIYVR